MVPTKKTLRSADQATNAENKARKARADHYANALKEYEEHCKTLFEYWKTLREEERNTRNRYAFWILIIAGLQSIIVYIGAGFCFLKSESATFLELFGLVTLICSQTFGLVFVVVKYFFGQKPEGLSEITQFISKTSPIPPLSPVLDKKTDSN